MKKLYLDNYRGFDKLFIEFTDINFLVGENSTGKTSILQMVKFLENKRIFDLNINKEITEFGDFKEVATNPSEDIHIWYETIEDNVKQFFLFVLRNDKGYVKVKSANLLVVKNEVKVNKNTKISLNLLIHGNKIYRRIREELEEDDINLSAWINSTIWISKTKEFQDVTELNGLGSMVRFISLKKEENIVDIPLRVYSTLQSHNKVNRIDPIRAKPQRIYDPYNIKHSSDGQHIPLILKKVFDSLMKSDKEVKKKILSFWQKCWIYKDLSIKQFWENSLSPFEMLVNLWGWNYKISNVGYGISQILPILTEILLAKSKSFLIQQPEIHLHPRAQAELWSLFFELTNKNKQFLVETHSDYIIDRYRLELKKSSTIDHKAQILFFERKNKKNKVSPIEINKKWNFSINQPTAFRKFFIKESFALLWM